jgi:hypothetical protein
VWAALYPSLWLPPIFVIPMSRSFCGLLQFTQYLATGTLSQMISMSFFRWQILANLFVGMCFGGDVFTLYWYSLTNLIIAIAFTLVKVTEYLISTLVIFKAKRNLGIWVIGHCFLLYIFTVWAYYACDTGSSLLYTLAFSLVHCYPTTLQMLRLHYVQVTRDFSQLYIFIEIYIVVVMDIALLIIDPEWLTGCLTCLSVSALLQIILMGMQTNYIVKIQKMFNLEFYMFTVPPNIQCEEAIADPVDDTNAQGVNEGESQEIPMAEA